MSLTAGTRLGPYEVIAPLGAGGMGEVYRARDARLGRDVAIKVLPADRQSVEARERFAREARAVAALQHLNICTVFDVGDTSDGQAYLVMELLEGEQIRSPLAIDRFLDIAIALADALDAAHAAGFIHRDIKPANIVLTARGPKILDFGIAKAVARHPADVTTKVTFQTTLGTTPGTPAYMSPEQLRGETLDARSDLFSLGLVLYEMLAGRPAFAGGTTAAIAAALLHQPPPPLSAARSDVPASVEAVVLKTLEKDRTLRYQHASELRRDLVRIKRDTSSVSDRREAAFGRPPAPRSHRRPWLIATVVGTVLSASGLAVFLMQPARAATLSANDTVVLAEFANTTGDPVFDDTLQRGLSVQLQQSPFLSLVPETRVRRTLAQMPQAANTRLTPDIAREVCERVGGTAVLDGSIAPLGSNYVMTLRAQSCATGDLIAEEQVQAARKEDVLDALSQAASAFRGRLGESLATVSRYSTPLPEATTSSIEALKAYSEARRLTLTVGNQSPAVLQLLRRATELDPAFAMAQGELGLAYSGIGEGTLTIEHTRRAFEHRARATEYERFKIDALYQRQVTGNLEKARNVFEAWIQVYPRDSIAHGLFAGFTTNGTGRLERGREESETAIALDPDMGYGYGNLAMANLFMGRFDEAAEAVTRGEKRGLKMVNYVELSYWLAFLKNDRAALARTYASADAEDPSAAHHQSLVPALHGELERARELSRRAVAIAERDERAEGAATYAVSEAVWEAIWGHAEAARLRARFGLNLAKGRDVQFGAALALALSGDAASAQPIADDLARRFPEDTSVQTNYLPVLRAFRSLAAHDPAKAIDALEPNRPYERAMPGIGFYWNFGGRYPIYLRGMALAALERWPDAAAEFKRLLDARGLLLADPLGALARVQLARSYVKAGDIANARATYDSFFALTTDADAGLPLWLEAKDELARLK